MTTQQSDSETLAVYRAWKRDRVDEYVMVYADGTWRHNYRIRRPLDAGLQADFADFAQGFATHPFVYGGQA